MLQLDLPYVNNRSKQVLDSALLRGVSICLARFLLIFLFILLGACASTPDEFHFETLSAENAVWPAPPEQPRYRFVGQLTGEENFQDPNKPDEFIGTRVLKWVVGFVTGKPIPVVLQRPQGVMVGQDGRVYVSDVSRQAVFVFDINQGKLLVWDMAAKNLPFAVPIAIAEGANGEILVADAKLGFVARLDQNGKPVGRIGEGQLSHPTGVTRDPIRNEIYIADTREHSIKVFDASGKLLRKFGKKGEAGGDFNSPTYLAMMGDHLYVADTLNSRIQILTLSGDLVREFGARGSFIGNLPRPKGVSVGKNGLVYVVESFNDYLLVFDSQGEFLLPIGGTGQGAGQFYLPAGVWVDNNNRVYIADMFNGRVVVFEFLGEGHEAG